MIGYYVHHHGSGHLARATQIAAACSHDVVGLSALPAPPDTAAFADWVRLADDPGVEDPDSAAGGALHWAPLRSDGYRDRMRELSSWVVANRPAAVVVDVSVEVAALVRLLGVPVVVVAMPGVRDDAPHRHAHRLARTIVAPWPRDVLALPHLAEFDAKTIYAGALSRFDDRIEYVPADGIPGSGVVLLGSGGDDVTEAQLDELRHVAGWTWQVLGGAAGWHSDVHRALTGAQVVVAHGGQNALAEIAAARRACVIIAQDRPFDEQRVTAAALQQAGIATSLPRWPAAHDWPAILRGAAARGGREWSRWNDGRAAARIAAAIDTAAAR